MNTHRFLDQYLSIAWGCMACDGDIADSEVSCLRSIAVQLGQPVEAVDPALSAARKAFSDSPTESVAGAVSELRRAGLSTDDTELLLDMLVQLAEADGVVRASERRFVREIVADLGLDRAALRRAHPEWSAYLAPTLVDRSGRRWLTDVVRKMPDLSEVIAAKR